MTDRPWDWPRLTVSRPNDFDLDPVARQKDFYFALFPNGQVLMLARFHDEQVFAMV